MGDLRLCNYGLTIDRPCKEWMAKITNYKLDLPLLVNLVKVL